MWPNQKEIKIMRLSFLVLLIICFYGCLGTLSDRDSADTEDVRELKADIQELEPELVKKFHIASVIVQDAHTVSVAIPWDVRKKKNAIVEFIQAKTAKDIKVTFALE